MNLTANTRRFIQILDKVPMFQRLKPHQALEVLKLCRPITVMTGELICRHGTESTEMYILLSGIFQIQAYDGTLLTRLSPVNIVGEMGLITGHPRSATVLAEQQGSILEISKIKFDVLLKKHPEIGYLIYRNIIHILSQRLEDTNTQLAASQRQITKLQGQPPARV